MSFEMIGKAVNKIIFAEKCLTLNTMKFAMKFDEYPAKDYPVKKNR